jgi:hypothetical protein
MAQIHHNFNDDEVKQLLLQYEDKTITKSEALDRLGIKDSRFYLLLKSFRDNPKAFTVTYGRHHANRKLPKEIVTRIHRELEADKRLIDNPNIPIMFYNYSSIRDSVAEATGRDKLSAQTVVNYAKQWGFYLERPAKQTHTRQVITNFTGMLLQHDASHHQWSPYAIDEQGKPIKWALITTLDDHSRKILYAELFERETA